MEKKFEPEISSNAIFRIDYSIKYSGRNRFVRESMLIESEEWPTLPMMRNAVGCKIGFFEVDITTNEMSHFSIISCTTQGNIWRPTS